MRPLPEVEGETDLNTEAKLALAKAYEDTVAAREASYIKGTGTYGLNAWDAARAAGVDEDMLPIVSAMVCSGYWDFGDAFEAIQKKYAQTP
jgi:hypothetical protein